MKKYHDNKMVSVYARICPLELDALKKYCSRVGVNTPVYIRMAIYEKMARDGVVITLQ